LTAVDVHERSASASPHGFDEYVERHAAATFFHSTTWAGLVVRHFPHRPRLLEATRDGRRVGVLPLFETRSPLSGRALVSSPYAVYGGPLASDEAAALALLEKVRTIVRAESLRFAELRCLELPATPSANDGGYATLPSSSLYATFLRELPTDPEECLAVIPRKSRASTRQARDRHGLSMVEETGERALDEFHRLFVLNKQRLGSPAFSRAWFADLLALGRRRVRLHLVRQEERVLAAVISFLHRETWNPYYSGAVPDADRVSANNFMYWQLMRTAAEEGFRRFDFGRSRVDTGPYHFKRNMGFEPTPLPYRYVLAPGAAVPNVNPSNASFSLPRRVLMGMPFRAVRAVGPRLMRLVP
jgi:FemAB-related protein (PEP-CTERM system-associated)